MALPAPVATNERIETLDVLRGFALLGILAMNIRAMAAPLSAYMNPTSLFDYSGASRLAYQFTGVVFDLKMMGLFSMLFGAGALLYAAKPGQGQASVTRLWFRRMAWLLVFGLVHAYLIWEGDILVPYALCGILVLWWVRDWSPRALIAGSIALLAVGVAMTVIHGLTWDSMSEASRAEELEIWMPTPDQVQAQLAAMLGSYPEVVAHRAPSVFLSQTFFFIAFFFWRCSGMMLLGMALLKLGFLDGRRSAREYAITALVWVPLGLGLAGAGVSRLEGIGFAMPERTMEDVWNYVGAVFASVGYAALLVLAVKVNVLGALGRALAAVGRMAFSNYLAHSVITSVLFLGWGFGLAGRFDYAEQLGVVLAIWLFQLLVSPIWLARYRFGPAEWLWRSLTYGRRQPMRRVPRQGQPSLAEGSAA
jgi:uncharacterized protein